MNGFMRGWLLLAAVVTSACMAPLQKLEKPLVEDEKAATVVIYLEQAAVEIDGAVVETGLGGVVGFLIENMAEGKMNSNRRKAFPALHGMLINYDYENRLVDALRKNLPLQLVRADASFKIVRNEQEWHQHLSSVVPANVLVIKTRYGFEQNFEIAYVHAETDLSHHHRVPPDKQAIRQMTIEQQRAAKPTILYRGSYYSQHATRRLFDELVNDEGLSGYETNAAAWAKDRAAPARQAFSIGINEVAQLIEADAQGQLPNPEDPVEMRIMAAHAYVGPIPIWTKVLARNGDRILVNFGHHHFWVDQRQVQRERR